MKRRLGVELEVTTDKVHALRLGTERHPLVKLRNTDDPPEKDRRTDT